MMRRSKTVSGKSLLVIGGIAVLPGLALVCAALACDESERVQGVLSGSIGLLLLVGGLLGVGTAVEIRRALAAEKVLHPTEGVGAPAMPELFATVADRSAKREGVALVLWGVVAIAVALRFLQSSPMNWVLLAMGAAMAVVGVFFSWRAVPAAFVVSGVFLALVGTWNLGVSFIDWAEGAPVSQSLALWCAFGLLQILASRVAFKRAHVWRVVLEKNRTVPARNTRLYLKWLVAAPTKNPYVASFSERLSRYGLLRRRARAYVDARTVLVVVDRGFECFALSCDAMARAIAGESVWDSAGVERFLSFSPEQAEKLRRLLAVSS